MIVGGKYIVSGVFYFIIGVVIAGFINICIICLNFHDLSVFHYGVSIHGYLIVVISIANDFGG